LRLEHWLYTIPLRFRSLFHRRRLDDELDEELRDHVEQKTEQNIAKGIAPQEARRQAMIEMGGVEKRSLIGLLAILAIRSPGRESTA
jgi:hypothetical protein